MLLDQYGNPIARVDRGTLRETRAGPTLAGVRSPFMYFLPEGIGPGRLAMIMRQADIGNSWEYMQLAEIMEERDPHYVAVLGTRKRQVGQLPISVEPVRDDADHNKQADFLREWLKTGVLQGALFDMGDAIGKGYSVLEIDWDVGPKQIVPRALTWRPQRYFEISQDDGDTVKLREGEGFVDLAPCKFIVHKHRNKSGLILRSGIARLVAWSWMLKEFGARDWATFVQNYGQPIRIGRYGPDISQEDREVLWTAIANIAGDCAALIPKDSEIEFVEQRNTTEGARLYREKCDWHDQQVSKAVLGQTTTTDAISGGHAVAKEHRLVQEDIERHDASLYGATLTAQLFAVMIGLNFPGAEDCPQCHIGRPDEVPLSEVVNTISRLAPFGLRVRTEDILQRLFMEKPKDGEDVIALPEADQAAVDADAKPPTRALEDAPDLDPALNSRRGMVRRMLSLHASVANPELVARMTEQLAADTEGALAGLTDQVRAVIEAAHDLPDLLHRLEKLELDPGRVYRWRLQRGLAVAHLAGQAALMEEIAAERPQPMTRKGKRMIVAADGVAGYALPSGECRPVRGALSLAACRLPACRARRSRPSRSPLGGPHLTAVHCHRARARHRVMLMPPCSRPKAERLLAIMTPEPVPMTAVTIQLQPAIWELERLGLIEAQGLEPTRLSVRPDGQPAGRCGHQVNN